MLLATTNSKKFADYFAAINELSRTRAELEKEKAAREKAQSRMELCFKLWYEACGDIVDLKEENAHLYAELTAQEAKIVELRKLINEMHLRGFVC